MADLSEKEKGVLLVRLNELMAGMQRLRKERVELTDLKKKRGQFKAPSEAEALKNKINLELLQRENEILKIENFLGGGRKSQNVRLQEAKKLIEKKGLKAQVQRALSAKPGASANVRVIDCSACITNCTHCVTDCTKTCITGCTHCTTCIKEEMVHHVPSVPVPVPV
jgi:hypothetical protein